MVSGTFRSQWQRRGEECTTDSITYLLGVMTITRGILVEGRIFLSYYGDFLYLFILLGIMFDENRSMSQSGKTLKGEG